MALSPAEEAKFWRSVHGRFRNTKRAARALLRGRIGGGIQGDDTALKIQESNVIRQAMKQSPRGGKWKPWSSATIAWRSFAGRQGVRLGQFSGRMEESFKSKRAIRDTATGYIYGENAPKYAVYFHRGWKQIVTARQARFLRMKFNANVKAGVTRLKAPPRELTGLNGTDLLFLQEGVANNMILIMGSTRGLRRI